MSKSAKYIQHLKAAAKRRLASGVPVVESHCFQPRYLPSPAEIETLCEKIRESWCEREFRHRAGLAWPPPKYEFPAFPFEQPPFD